MDDETRAAFEAMGVGGFVERLGLHLDEVGPERVTGHVDCGPDHHQPFGIVHGGVYASIVETLGSIGGSVLAAEHGAVVVGVNNSTDFLRAHREGRIDAVAEPVHVGRTQQLWQVVMTREDGKVVARGQLRLQALPKDRELAGQPAV